MVKVAMGIFDKKNKKCIKHEKRKTINKEAEK
jgi:histone H3/H4